MRSSSTAGETESECQKKKSQKARAEQRESNSKRLLKGEKVQSEKGKREREV